MVRGYKVTILAAAFLGAAVCGLLIAQVSGVPTPSRVARPAVEDTAVVTITTTLSPTSAIPIVVRSGNTFSLTVPANHTTGYQWKLGNQPNVAIVRRTGSVYNEPNTTMLGAGGTETWSFQAAGRGKTTLVLQYVRPWEKNTKPVRTQTFAVNVQ